MLDADKIYRAIVGALKKHCETPSIRHIDTEAVARKMLVDLGVLVFEEVQRITAELTKQYTVVSMPYKHYMLQGPECLGDHNREPECASCSSRKLCDVLSEGRRDAASGEQTTTQEREGGDLQGQEREILDPVRGRP